MARCCPKAQGNLLRTGYIGEKRTINGNQRRMGRKDNQQEPTSPKEGRHIPRYLLF